VGRRFYAKATPLRAQGRCGLPVGCSSHERECARSDSISGYSAAR